MHQGSVVIFCIEILIKLKENFWLLRPGLNFPKETTFKRVQQISSTMAMKFSCVWFVLLLRLGPVLTTTTASSVSIIFFPPEYVS